MRPPNREDQPSRADGFDRAASRLASLVGRPPTVFLNLALVIAAFAIGAGLRFSDRWLALIALGLTVVTYLLVFILQFSQNKNDAATHAKLDELIRSAAEAKNDFIGLEQQSEDEIEAARETHHAEAALQRELGTP